ncbi:MAG TPA: c-type cytochrome [Anaerolineales bacterium]|jgi:mono/diheme cytochrome c family protein
MSFFQRLLVVVAVAALLLSVLLVFSYDIIKIDWISFMEIQPSFRPMEDPLPVAARSIPVEGAAYIPGQGAPENPVKADAASVERGRILYSVTCIQCHGPNADGNGVIGGALVFPPANLTADVVQNKPDGALFLTISNGIQGTAGQIHMPALNENLTVRDRWDVVNYIRTIKATTTPTATPAAAPAGTTAPTATP